MFDPTMFDPKISLSVTTDADLLYAKARKDGIETVWERHDAQQPQCGFCDMGLSCRICVMGPCRVDPFGEGPQTGVCGADADIIVARNLCRMIAAGAASHSDHGRDLVEVLAAVADGSAVGYRIRDEAKLQRVAAEYGVITEGKEPLAIAGDLAQAMMEDYGMRRKAVRLVDRAPQKRREVWQKFNLTPRGIDRETSEMMHRTRMISTSDKAQFPQMEHVEFHPHNAEKKAFEVVRTAVENFTNRKGAPFIPVEPQAAVGGFSVETIIGALGGTPEPLIEAIKEARSVARWALSAAITRRSSTTTAMSP